MPSNDAPHSLAVSFSEKDTARLTELTDEFMERLPAIIENTSKGAAERLLKTLKRNWPEQAAYETAVFDGFRGRLEARWGEGFNLLRMLLTSCRELGEGSAKRLRRSRAHKNRVLRSLMVRLHARACQITAEIITLMKNGFADGAMARWRTLYEVGVVATVIADAGESLAKCYIQHEVIESKLAMDEYARCHVALGYKPIPHRERRRVERAFAAAVKAHGADFGKPYGWAAAHLKKKRVTFRDLEDAAQQSGMRSYYKMASYNVHADTPKSIFCRLGVIGDQSIVIAGATDAGFTEPAQNAAITLIQITGLLLADRASNLDVMTKLRALTMIRDEIPDSFMRTERKLKRDHARLSTMNQSKSGSEEGEGAASPSHLIDARIKELGDWRGETLARVRSLIKEAAPEVVEEWKWRGVPVWSHAGIICTGETYKNAVKMTFAKGASLEDPSGLFNASLEGTTRRAIDLHEGDTIDEEALNALIRAAVALNISVRATAGPVRSRKKPKSA